METNAIVTSHIEATDFVTKRIKILGKTLIREMNGKKITETVEVNGKKTEVEAPFTVLNAKDMDTGEPLRQGICIPHRGAKSRMLDHLCVDPNAYPNTSGNIECNYGESHRLCREYEVTLRYIPEGAEYQDKNGEWHAYRKTNTYILEMAMAVAKAHDAKADAVLDMFELMQGYPYNPMTATAEDKHIYLELTKAL
jgi:hypothetical protein